MDNKVYRFPPESAENQIYKDLYAIHAKYKDPDETEEYWDGFIDEIGKLYIHDEFYELRRGYARVLADFLENKLKRKRGTENAETDRI